MGDIKRYHCPVLTIDHTKWGTDEATKETMVELDTGDYVLYSDHQAKVTELGEEKQRYKAHLEKIKFIVECAKKMSPGSKVLDRILEEVTSQNT